MILCMFETTCVDLYLYTQGDTRIKTACMGKTEVPMDDQMITVEGCVGLRANLLCKCYLGRTPSMENCVKTQSYPRRCQPPIPKGIVTRCWLSWGGHMEIKFEIIDLVSGNYYFRFCGHMVPLGCHLGITGVLVVPAVRQTIEASVRCRTTGDGKNRLNL